MKLNSRYLLAVTVFLLVSTSTYASGFSDRGSKPHPLAVAIKNNDLAEVRAFVKAGADVSEDFGSGVTPLLSALSYGHLEIAKYLIKQGSNINARDTLYMGEDHHTPLSIAAHRGYLDVVKLLLVKEANPNHCVTSAGVENGTPLTIALKRNHLEIAKVLVTQGADVNAVGCQYGDYGVTPLCAAAKHSEMTEFLLSEGADVNGRGQDGSTALMCAVTNGNLESIELLVKAGADVNAKDHRGRTALMRVFSIDTRGKKVDDGSFRAFHKKFQSWKADLVGLLIRHGVDPNIRDNNGKTFAEIAKEKNSHYLIPGTESLEPGQFTVSRPQLYRFMPSTIAYGGDISGQYLYLAEAGNQKDSLEILDISDLNNLASISTTPLSQEGLNVVVEHNIAYVAADRHGLQIFDVSNPNSPSLLGQIDFPGFSIYVKVIGKLAYVLVTSSGAYIKVVDVSEPASPKVVGEFYSKRDLASRFYVYRNHIFLAHKKAGLYIIDISQPAFPMLKSQYAFEHPVSDVLVTNDVAYVGLANHREIRILDVSEPQSPKIVEEVDLTQKVASYRDTVFVKDYQLVVDISDPDNPKMIGVLSHRTGLGFNYVVHNNLVVKIYEKQILEFSGPVIQPTKPSE